MSNDRLTQLTQAIKAMDNKFDDRFQAMDNKFEAMDNKFEAKFEAMDKKLDNQFMKAFRYMDKEFKTVRGEIAETKGLVNSCVNMVDAYMKRTEIYHHEMLSLGHKVDRHEKWHHQTAKACGIKFQA